jgi:hypothetical protein
MDSFAEFSWREKRIWLRSQVLPTWVDFGTTDFPQNKNCHISLYGFRGGDISEHIKERGRKHSKKYEHYSSNIVIDCEEDSALRAVLSILHEHQFGYSLYKTGGRGHHIHLPRIANPSSHLYTQDRTFLLQMFGEIPYVDHGIYNSPMHLIRCPGREHETTKEKKELLAQQEGQFQPDIRELEPLDFLMRSHKNCDNFKPQFECNNTWSYIQNRITYHSPVSTGQVRYTALFTVAKDLAKVGLRQDTILDLLTFLNTNNENPLDDNEYERAVCDGISAAK